LNGVLTKGSLLAGETFSTIYAQEATKFGATTQLFQFGTNPPVAVIKYEGKTYYHITKDPAKPDTGKHASMKAKKHRCEAITKARYLLKNNEVLHTKQ
jgi:predicted DNA-binding protein (MmcQ/YjbR family)